MVITLLSLPASGEDRVVGWWMWLDVTHQTQLPVYVSEDGKTQIYDKGYNLVRSGSWTFVDNQYVFHYDDNPDWIDYVNSISDSRLEGINKQGNPFYADRKRLDLEGYAGGLSVGRIDIAVQTAPLPLIKALGAKFSYNKPTSGEVVTFRREQNMPLNYDGTPQYLFDFHEEIPADVKKVKVRFYWYDGNKWWLIKDSEWGSTYTFTY